MTSPESSPGQAASTARAMEAAALPAPMTSVRPFGGGGKWRARTRAGSAAEIAVSNSDRNRDFSSNILERSPNFMWIHRLISTRSGLGGRLKRCEHSLRDAYAFIEAARKAVGAGL